MVNPFIYPGLNDQSQKKPNTKIDTADILINISVSSTARDGTLQGGLQHICTYPTSSCRRLPTCYSTFYPMNTEQDVDWTRNSNLIYVTIAYVQGAEDGLAGYYKLSYIRSKKMRNMCLFHTKEHYVPLGIPDVSSVIMSHTHTPI